MAVVSRALALLLCFGLAALLPAGPANTESSQVLASYVAAWHAQQGRLNGSVAEVNIDAEVPRLHKRGRLSAFRHISRLGRLTYDALRFEGDNTVKTSVIARYLSAEAQARESGSASLAVTPENYKFSYKGLRELEGRRVYLFDLKPRAKRKGLFKGSLWIDAATYLPVRESGRWVKNPSVFIKKVQFTRDYDQREGVAVVSRLHTTVDTRLVGPAHMTVQYGDYRFEPPAGELGQISPDSSAFFCY